MMEAPLPWRMPRLDRAARRRLIHRVREIRAPCNALSFHMIASHPFIQDYGRVYMNRTRAIRLAAQAR